MGRPTSLTIEPPPEVELPLADVTMRTTRKHVPLSRSSSLPAKLQSPSADLHSNDSPATCRPRLVKMWSTVHEDVVEAATTPLQRAVARLPSVSFSVEEPEEVPEESCTPTPRMRYQLLTPRRRFSLTVERRRFASSSTRVRTTFSIDVGLLQMCLLLMLLSTASSLAVQAFRASASVGTVSLSSVVRSAVLTSSSALPTASPSMYHTATRPRPPAALHPSVQLFDALKCAVGAAAAPTAKVARGLRSALPTARRSVLSAMLSADHKMRSFEVGSAAALAACACAACMTGALCEAGCAVLMPDAFGAMRKWHGQRQRLAHDELDHIENRLRNALPYALGTAGSNATSITKRVKSVRSTFEKVALRGKDLDDLLALRVIVEPSNAEESAEAACIERVRQVHTLVESLWPGGIVQVKDYVANPKANGYQSLHLLVRLPSGWRCELQVRTRCMHDHAEHGAAAHADYKADSLILT